MIAKIFTLSAPLDQCDCGVKSSDPRDHAPTCAVDGHEVDLAEFYVDNDISPEQANEIGALRVGECVLFGGGAAEEFELRRVE